MERKSQLRILDHQSCQCEAEDGGDVDEGTIRLWFVEGCGCLAFVGRGTEVLEEFVAEDALKLLGRESFLQLELVSQGTGRTPLPECG